MWVQEKGRCKSLGQMLHASTVGLVLNSPNVRYAHDGRAAFLFWAQGVGRSGNGDRLAGQMTPILPPRPDRGPTTTDVHRRGYNVHYSCINTLQDSIRRRTGLSFTCVHTYGRGLGSDSECTGFCT